MSLIKRIKNRRSKKYKLLKTDILTVPGGSSGIIILHRIKALKDFGNVKKGDLGGYIGSEKNLSHEGKCWVHDNAKVYDNAHIGENAEVFDYVVVNERAHLYDNASAYDNAWIHGSCDIYGNANINDDSEVFGGVNMSDNADLFGSCKIGGFATIYGDSIIEGNAEIYGGHIYNTKIGNDALIIEDKDYISIKNFNWNCNEFTFYRCKDSQIRVIPDYSDDVFTLDEFKEYLREEYSDYQEELKCCMAFVYAVEMSFKNREVGEDEQED